MQLNIPIANLPRCIDLVSLDPHPSPIPVFPTAGPEGGRASTRQSRKKKLPQHPRPGRLLAPLFVPMVETQYSRLRTRKGRAIRP